MQPHSKHVLRIDRSVLSALIIAAVVVAGWLGYPREPSSRTSSRVFSVCEVLWNIDKLEGKVIRVRGVYFGAIRDQCPTAIREWGGAVWPAALNIADSDLAASLKRPVEFETDRNSWAALETFWMKEARKNAREEIWATFEGAVQSADPESRRLGGFGHLGAFPAQLVVKSVDVGSISIVANPTYEYKVEGPTR